jgi:WD40 repeat protein
MPTGRQQLTATGLTDGRVLVVGGSTTFDTSNETAKVDLYDPATNTWTAGPSLAKARFSHSATRLLDGRVVVAGGFGSGGGTANSCELFEPATNIWSSCGTLTNTRAGHEAHLLPDGRVALVLGDVGSQLGSIEIYDPATSKWTQAVTFTIRWGAASALLPDGKVLVTGGLMYLGGVPNAVKTTFIYDPATGMFTSAAPMGNARVGHGAALLPNGKVLVAGGKDDPNISLNLKSAELYDPATNAWSPTGTVVGRMNPLGVVAGGELLPGRRQR